MPDHKVTERRWNPEHTAATVACDCGYTAEASSMAAAKRDRFAHAAEIWEQERKAQRQLGGPQRNRYQRPLDGDPRPLHVMAQERADAVAAAQQ